MDDGRAGGALYENLYAMFTVERLMYHIYDDQTTCCPTAL